MRRLLLALTLAVAACGAARLPEDAECQRAIDDLRVAKATGVACEVAKARVAVDHPSCKLVFVCNLRGGDAGAVHE